MDINVHVTLDASDKLTKIVFAVAAMVNPTLVDTVSEPKPAPAPAPAPTPAPTSEPVPTTAYDLSAVPEPAPKSEPAPKPEPAPEPAQNAEKDKALTIDDVRRVCLRATKAGKTKVVTDFLDAQGVKNLPALDPSLYDALVTVVEDNL